MYMLCSLVLFDPLPPHPLTQLISHCVDPGSMTLQRNATSVSLCSSTGRGKFPPGVVAAMAPEPGVRSCAKPGVVAAMAPEPGANRRVVFIRG